MGIKIGKLCLGIAVLLLSLIITACNRQAFEEKMFGPTSWVDYSTLPDNELSTLIKNGLIYTPDSLKQIMQSKMAQGISLEQVASDMGMQCSAQTRLCVYRAFATVDFQGFGEHKKSKNHYAITLNIDEGLDSMVYDNYSEMIFIKPLQSN